MSDQLPRLVRKVRSVKTKANEWTRQFKDVTGTVRDYRLVAAFYYKSECRPLKELKKLHTAIARKALPLTFRAWLDARDRARKDLYWLGHECIDTEASGSSFVEHVHREMCEMFVQKNFDGVYFKGFTLDEVRKAIDTQQRVKEMLMLAPRGSYKSTCNKIDCVQWMLNCPDIRILIITGVANLADTFLKAVKGFFYQPDKTPPTYFQKLFPRVHHSRQGWDQLDRSNLPGTSLPARRYTDPVGQFDWRQSGRIPL